MRVPLLHWLNNCTVCSTHVSQMKIDDTLITAVTTAAAAVLTETIEATACTSGNIMVLSICLTCVRAGI
jgi:hypothetical protein